MDFLLFIKTLKILFFFNVKGVYIYEILDLVNQNASIFYYFYFYTMRSNLLQPSISNNHRTRISKSNMTKK